MKKGFRYYLIAWAALLALFNVIAFVSVGWTGYEKYTDSFWIGYVFITLSFVGQLGCAWFALKEDDRRKRFYNIPLITISYSGLILSCIFGGLCMIISPLPYWFGGILCAILLALNVVAVVKVAAAAELVSTADQKIQVQTFFIRSLTADAQSLMARAQSTQAKDACKKVFEAVRYSDPMTHDALSSVEGQITIVFARLAEAVTADDPHRTAEAAEELRILLADRNGKCKLLK